MRFTNTTRWVTAGAVFGLAAAAFAGVAFAATPGSIARSGGSQPTRRGASTPVLVAERTTTALSGGNAPPSASVPVGTSTMMSEMLASLSPQARAEFQTLYPQMLQLMDSSHMMSGAGTAGSMMGQGVAGNRLPTSGGQPSTS
ncbi:MAG: hypothetical protein M0Z29_05980 [Actinomycetota bacterium]|nr:hypothetical protein [Actinomycetota bacterium]